MFDAILCEDAGLMVNVRVKGESGVKGVVVTITGI